VATEAAWLNGNNCEKEEINEAEREKKRKDERKVLTLTGLLMEGLILSSVNMVAERIGLKATVEPRVT
jgi:uncharacterized protein with ACT and thioredoxin-like domain